MLNKKILAFTAALLAGGSALMGQLNINEEDTKKVDNQIKVDGPAEGGEVKRAKADDLNFIS